MTKVKTLAFFALICIFAPSAYGQMPGTPLATQDFNGTWLPSGWSVVEWAGTGNNWYNNNNFEEAAGVPMVNHTGGSGTCAAAADIDPGNLLAWDAGLFSPAVNLTNYSAATLSFRHDFVAGTNGRGRVWMYDPWSGYWLIDTFTADTSGSPTYDISWYTGWSWQVVFEFDSGPNDDSYWQVDDVGVTGVVITGVDLQANWGVFRYDGRLFTRVDVRNLGWNPSGTFSVRQQVFDSTFTNVLADTTRTFTQNARGRALLPGRVKTAKFWVTNRSDLRNGWVFVNVVRAAGPDDFDENSPLSFGVGNNQLWRQVR